MLKNLIFIFLFINQAYGQKYFIDSKIVDCAKNCQVVEAREPLIKSSDTDLFINKKTTVIPFRVRSETELQYKDDIHEYLMKEVDIADFNTSQAELSRYPYMYNVSGCQNLVCYAIYGPQPRLNIIIRNSQERLTLQEINELIKFNKIEIYREKDDALIKTLDFSELSFRQVTYNKQEGEIIFASIKTLHHLIPGNYYFIFETSVNEKYYDSISIEYKLI